MRETAMQNIPVLNLHKHIQFDVPLTKLAPTFQTIDLFVVRSPLTLKYLGQYVHLFDSPAE